MAQVIGAVRADLRHALCSPPRMNRISRAIAGIALIVALVHALLHPQAFAQQASVQAPNPTQAMPADAQPVEAIREAARHALSGSGADAEPRVDARLRLPACRAPLSAVVVRPTTVDVRCPDPGWNLYVPVRLRRLSDVLVLRRTVTPGEALTAADVVVEQRDLAGIAGAGPNAVEQVEGQTARRLLASGTVLAARDLVAPRAIRRGDAIALVARIGGTEVRAEGRALGDAAVGGRLNVENLGSRRIVQAWARSPGEAEVR